MNTAIEEDKPTIDEKETWKTQRIKKEQKNENRQMWKPCPENRLRFAVI